jgi:hypothetical protein
MTKDAGLASMTAERVDVLELFEHDDPDALPGQRPAGGGSHCAAANHNHVRRHHAHRVPRFMFISGTEWRAE